MTMTQLAATLGVALLAIFSGASAAAVVNAWARRKVTTAEADSKVVEAADVLMTRQQIQLDRGDAERLQQREEIQQLKSHISKIEAELTDLRILAKRFESIEGQLPMSDFSDNGWLTALNVEVAHPRGLHVTLFTDNYTEEAALGHDVRPIEELPLGRFPGTEQVEQIMEDLDDYSNKVREDHGYPPINKEEEQA